MLSLIKAIAMAKVNKARLARILGEIDEPRNQAIAEARLSARCFIDGLVKENAIVRFD